MTLVPNIDGGKIEDQIAKILVVDDKEDNLSRIKNIIKDRFENNIIDTAKNGEEAVQKITEGDYGLIFMDINMPIMNGILATKKIREFNKNVPIIAYTSMSDGREMALEAGCNDYIIKPADPELLIKTICKWSLVKYRPPLPKSEEKIKSILQNKKILIVDDEKIHRFMLKTYFAKKFSNIEIDEGQDGQEMIDKVTKYPNSKPYDIIISDANMPIMDSLVATKEIREYQLKNNIKNIPIIAFSAYEEKEKIHEFFNAGMNDYFIKGDDMKNLVMIILFWLNQY